MNNPEPENGRIEKAKDLVRIMFRDDNEGKIDAVEKILNEATLEELEATYQLSRVFVGPLASLWLHSRVRVFGE